MKKELLAVVMLLFAGGNLLHSHMSMTVLRI